MSAGSKIVNVRFEDELLKKMTEEINRVNARRRKEPYRISTFIRDAVREKLAHYARSRRSLRQPIKAKTIEEFEAEVAALVAEHDRKESPTCP